MVSHKIVAVALLDILRWWHGATLVNNELSISITRAVIENSFSGFTVQAVLRFQFARVEKMNNATVTAFEQGTKDFFQSNLFTGPGEYFLVNSTVAQSQDAPCTSPGGKLQSNCFLDVDLLVDGAASEPLANGDIIFGKLLLEVVALNLDSLIFDLNQRSKAIGSLLSVDIVSNVTQSPVSSSSQVPTMAPSPNQSANTSTMPSDSPSLPPSKVPSAHPSAFPSQHPSLVPSQRPSLFPSTAPSLSPSFAPSYSSQAPSHIPSANPSLSSSSAPSQAPTTESDNVHNAAITVQLQGMTQMIPANDKQSFEDVALNFISEVFPTIQGFQVKILSVAVTSQVLSNRRLISQTRTDAAAPNLLVGMNVTGIVTSTGNTSAISNLVFQNLVSQAFQDHFDDFTSSLIASSNLFDNLTSSTPNAPKKASTFVIVLSVSLGAIAALTVAGVTYWINSRRSKPHIGVPKEVNAIQTSSTKELEFDTGSRERSIPKFLDDIHSLATPSRQRAVRSISNRKCLSACACFDSSCLCSVGHKRHV
jgi:hypothetical protein